jgi:hypothetical protein
LPAYLHFANGNNAFVPEPERRNSGSPRCVEPAIHRNSFGQQRLSVKEWVTTSSRRIEPETDD